MMQVVEPDESLARLLSDFERAQGVLEYILLEADRSGPSEPIHRQAAMLGMAAIDARWAERVRLWYPHDPSRQEELQIVWEEAKAQGRRISFSEFWGTDDIFPRVDALKEWRRPGWDGYKSAFFLGPCGYLPSKEACPDLFGEINKRILGETPRQCEVYRWSTDWSNYFQFGRTDMGPFYWTIRQPDPSRLAVIAAVAVD